MVRCSAQGSFVYRKQIESVVYAILIPEGVSFVQPAFRGSDHQGSNMSFDSLEGAAAELAEPEMLSVRIPHAVAALEAACFRYTNGIGHGGDFMHHRAFSAIALAQISDNVDLFGHGRLATAR